MGVNQLRSKWAAVGAAVAVTLGAGGIGITHATTSSGERPIFLPIEPCRLADTRPDFQVGDRDTPLGADETYTLDGEGAVGDCNLPSGTAALSLNVTALDASAPTFISLFPAGATLPVASHLNPLPGQGPTPNAVNVDLSAGGEFSIYNLAGSVNVIIDVVGIFDDHHHDDRYYTEGEVDTELSGKADVGDSYTKSESDGRYDNGDADIDSPADVGLSPTDTVVASVTVDTPTSGYVTVNSGGFVFDGSTSLVVRCSIETGTAVDTDHSTNVNIAANGRQPIGTTRGFQINKVFPFSPDESTYNLVCDTNTGTTSYINPHLTAVFTPDPDAFGLIIVPLEEPAVNLEAAGE